MLTYKKLQDRPRDFLAATSLTLEEFLPLLPACEAAYLQRDPRERTPEGHPRQRRVGGGATGAFPSLAEKLLCM